MSSDIIANRLSEALANVALLDPIPGKQKQLSRPIDIPSATEQWIQSGGVCARTHLGALVRDLCPARAWQTFSIS